MVRMSDILKKRQNVPPEENLKPKDDLPPEEGKVCPSGQEALVAGGADNNQKEASAVPLQPEAASIFAKTVGQKEQPVPSAASEGPSSEEGKPCPPGQDSSSGDGKIYLSGRASDPAMQISLAMKEFEPDMERSKELYAKALKLARELLKKAQAKEPIGFKEIKSLSDEFVNYLVLGDKTLLNLFYDNYDPQEYLPHHMVNVMIMSISVGLGLRCNRSTVDELSLGAFLNDIGISEYLKLALQPRQLSAGEYNQIKDHISASVMILSSIKELPEAVIQAIKETHERMDGKGYPKGIKGEELSEYARIIAIADTYEAAIHSRVYRRSPHEVIKEMLSSASGSFDGRVLKAFINLIGIYPAGSYVELNSAEIAKVISSNDNFPLRPMVHIIFDSNRKRLNEPRLINLAKQFNLYIKNQLSDEDVAKLTKEG